MFLQKFTHFSFNKNCTLQLRHFCKHLKDPPPWFATPLQRRMCLKREMIGLGMVVSMINSSVSNKIHFNLFQPEGGPDLKLDTDILNVMLIKQENSSKGFSSFRTAKDTAERVHQACSAGVCCYLL